MRFNIEVQLMRDWQPRSRPTRGTITVGEGTPTPDTVKLYPGAAAVGSEMMLVYFENNTRSGQDWVSSRVALTIDGTHIGEPRPALFWIGGYSDIVTGIVHFPVVAGYDNLMYRGHHSLLLRIVK